MISPYQPPQMYHHRTQVNPNVGRWMSVHPTQPRTRKHRNLETWWWAARAISTTQQSNIAQSTPATSSSVTSAPAHTSNCLAKRGGNTETITRTTIKGWTSSESQSFPSPTPSDGSIRRRRKNGDQGKFVDLPTVVPLVQHSKINVVCKNNLYHQWSKYFQDWVSQHFKFNIYSGWRF